MLSFNFFAKWFSQIEGVATILQCTGFMQTDNKIEVGGPISDDRISVYGGGAIYYTCEDL